MKRTKNRTNADRPEKGSRSVLLDTNLLLVFVVGLYSPAYVSRHKNTRDYTAEDFFRLRKVVDTYPDRLTTPHILAEVSNLLAQSKRPARDDLFKTFAQVIDDFDERPVAARRIAANDRFVDFGLTELGILEATGPNCVVLTADSRLADFLARSNLSVLDYQTLRRRSLLDD